MKITIDSLNISVWEAMDKETEWQNVLERELKERKNVMVLIISHLSKTSSESQGTEAESAHGKILVNQHGS